MEDDILIVYCTIILNIFIIVIIGCPILNGMTHYVGQWKLLWVVGSGNPTSLPGYFNMKSFIQN